MLALTGLFFVAPVKSNEQTDPYITCTISFEKPVLTEIQLNNRTFIQITMEDCISSARTGDPALPVYAARILVPKGKVVVGVSASYSNVVKMDCDVQNKPIVPQQDFHPLSECGVNYPFMMNETTYNSSDIFFDKIYESEDIGFCRGFTILTVYLYPVQYMPNEGLLYYLPAMTVKVNLENDDCAVLDEGSSLLRYSNSDAEFVSSIVVNPDAIGSYFSSDGALDGGNMPNGGDGGYIPLGGGYAPLNYSGGLCDPSERYEYVIITNNNLKDTTGYEYNWSDLIDHRSNYSGLNGTIVTVEEIDACSDYWNDTSTFNDSQAHIREFCKDAYLDWGTEYVILGGDWTDGTSSQQIVPYRLFTDRDEDGTYDTMACDMYYSHLDGDWYYSSSDVWGGGKNGANDLYGELFVGRITAYNASMVSNAVKKIIWYDMNASNDWLRKASFWGGNLGLDWSVTSKQYMEELRLGDDTYRTFTGFEEWNTANPEYTIDTSERLYHADLGSDYETYFSNSVEDDNASIINHLDHSNLDTPFGLANWLYRYNTKPFFGYSQGCLAGRFHDGDAGCEQMMCRHPERHAYALVLNTGYGYGNPVTTDGPSQYIQCYFWDYFFNNQSNNMENWQLGKAFSYAQDKMGAIVNSQSSHAWCYAWYSAHLFGDPAQTFRIVNSNRSVVFSGETPIDGATNVSIATLSLNVTIRDPEGDSFNWTIETSPDVGNSSANGAGNGSKSCDISGLDYSTTYHWFVNATDTSSGEWVRESYSFTTESAPVDDPPTFSNLSVGNGSTGVSLGLSSLSIIIRDPEGDSFNWSIETSPDIGSNSNTNATNGTKSCNISGLSYNTTYNWYVNATDGSNWTRTRYWFTTRAQYTPNPPSSFSATAFNRTRTDLSWTHGSCSNKVYIRYATGDYPTNRSSGDYLCNETGNSFSANGLVFGTKYYFRAWSWNTTDCVWSSSYSSANATPSNHNPTISDEYPDNQSTGVSISTTYLSVNIEDHENDSFNWSIETNPDIGSNSGTGAFDGTKTCSVSGLQYSNNYHWYVNVTDGFGWTNKSYIFTAQSQPQDNPSPPYNPPPKNNPPVANAGGPYAGHVSQLISFNGSGSHDPDVGDTLTYSWNFGDGATGTGTSPLHSYTSLGVYTINLTVSDGKLTSSNTATATITEYVEYVPINNSSNGQNKTGFKHNNTVEELKELLGYESLNESNIRDVSISNGTCYLVDIDNDGVCDIFYDSVSGNKSVLGFTKDGGYLIDVNNDGEWDYVYYSASSRISPYEVMESREATPFSLWLVTIITTMSAIVVCLAVFFKNRSRLLNTNKNADLFVHTEKSALAGTHHIHFFSQGVGHFNHRKPPVAKMKEYNSDEHVKEIISNESASNTEQMSSVDEVDYITIVTKVEEITGRDLTEGQSSLETTGGTFSNSLKDIEDEIDRLFFKKDEK